MLKIRVRNFQSIRDAELEIQGLTVVTGPNNSGKSALVRAFQGVFTNPRGFRYVRHGAENCRVDLGFGDGHSLVWEKGPRDNRYTLDGKVLERVGAGVPPEVAALGVVPLEAAGREIWPQFAPQFTGQVFLLDEPGSVLAEAIADVNRVGVLNEALRLAQSDRKALSAELRVRSQEVERLEEQERKFQGLDEALAWCREAEELQLEMRRIREEKRSLEELRNRLRETETEVRRLTAIRSVELPRPAESEHLKSAGDHRDRMVGVARQHRGVRTALEHLRPLRGVELPTIEDTARLTKGERALGVVGELRARLRTSQEAVRQSRATRADLARVELPPAEPPWESELTRREELNRWRGALVTGTSTRDLLTPQIAQTALETDTATQTVNQLRQELGSCPLCGNTPTPHPHSP